MEIDADFVYDYAIDGLIRHIMIIRKELTVMKHSKLTILLALLMAFLMISSAMAETFSSEVTWEDPITGTQSGQLTINPETE